MPHRGRTRLGSLDSGRMANARRSEAWRHGTGEVTCLRSSFGRSNRTLVMGQDPSVFQHAEYLLSAAVLALREEVVAIKESQALIDRGPTPLMPCSTDRNPYRDYTNWY